MRLIINSLCFLFFSLVFIGCGTQKNTIEKSETPKDNIIYYDKGKGRCMTCPVYSVQINPDLSVIYVGKQNVKPMDTVRFAISDKQYKTIWSELHKTDFNTYNDTYFSNIQDLPVSQITFNEKLVRFQKKECPVSLQHFVELIEKLVTE